MPNGGSPSAGELAGYAAQSAQRDIAKLEERFSRPLHVLVSNGTILEEARTMINQPPADEKVMAYTFDHTVQPHNKLELGVIAQIPAMSTQPVVGIHEVYSKLHELANAWEKQDLTGTQCVQQLREAIGGQR